MATDDFFRSRLDQMIDLEHPLVVLSNRMPWAQIENALAPAFARKSRSGRMRSRDDLFGTSLEIAGAGAGASAGVSVAGSTFANKADGSAALPQARV